MIIDQAVINALAVEFIRKQGGYISGDLLPSDSSVSLGSSKKMFSDLYVKTIHATTITSTGTSSDSVDGFHASATPKPNTLLALDSEGKFPLSIFGEVLTPSGGTLRGNLSVSAGVLIDGVDISDLNSKFGAHKALSASAAHAGIGEHDHKTLSTGGDLVQYASANGSGTRSAYKAERLNKKITAGPGLIGGGLLDANVSLEVRVGNGLSISGTAVALTTPGSLSASSTNTSVGNHTHAVTASSSPTGESLLKSDSGGGLTVQKLVARSGGVSSIGDVTGNRIISTTDAFVGSDLTVATNLLSAVKERKTVYINRSSTVDPVQGALVVRPGSAAHRGLVVQGVAGQLGTAPLISVVDNNNTEVFVVGQNGNLESGNPAFVSGMKGWRIDKDGDAEFRNIRARGELHTSVFVSDEIHATGGTMTLLTAGVVDNPIDANDNLIGGTFDLVVAGNPHNPGVCTFKLNDVLRLKLKTGLQEN